MTSTTQCLECGGYGAINTGMEGCEHEYQCGACNGTGLVEQDEIDAKNLYNSDNPIFDFIVISGGSIGPSKLTIGDISK